MDDFSDRYFQALQNPEDSYQFITDLKNNPDLFPILSHILDILFQSNPDINIFRAVIININIYDFSLFPETNNAKFEIVYKLIHFFCIFFSDLVSVETIYSIITKAYENGIIDTDYIHTIITEITTNQPLAMNSKFLLCWLMGLLISCANDQHPNENILKYFPTLTKVFLNYRSYTNLRNHILECIFNCPADYCFQYQKMSLDIIIKNLHYPNDKEYLSQFYYYLKYHPLLFQSNEFYHQLASHIISAQSEIDDDDDESEDMLMSNVLAFLLNSEEFEDLFPLLSFLWNNPESYQEFENYLIRFRDDVLENIDQIVNGTPRSYWLLFYILKTYVLFSPSFLLSDQLNDIMQNFLQYEIFGDLDIMAKTGFFSVFYVIFNQPSVCFSFLNQDIIHGFIEIINQQWDVLRQNCDESFDKFSLIGGFGDLDSDLIYQWVQLVSLIFRSHNYYIINEYKQFISSALPSVPGFSILLSSLLQNTVNTESDILQWKEIQFEEDGENSEKIAFSYFEIACTLIEVLPFHREIFGLFIQRHNEYWDFIQYHSSDDDVRIYCQLFGNVIEIISLDLLLGNGLEDPRERIIQWALEKPYFEFISFIATCDFDVNAKNSLMNRIQSSDVSYNYNMNLFPQFSEEIKDIILGMSSDELESGYNSYIPSDMLITIIIKLFRKRDMEGYSEYKLRIVTLAIRFLDVLLFNPFEYFHLFGFLFGFKEEILSITENDISQTFSSLLNITNPSPEYVLENLPYYIIGANYGLSISSESIQSLELSPETAALFARFFLENWEAVTIPEDFVESCIAAEDKTVGMMAIILLSLSKFEGELTQEHLEIIQEYTNQWPVQLGSKLLLDCFTKILDSPLVQYDEVYICVAKTICKGLFIGRSLLSFDVCIEDVEEAFSHIDKERFALLQEYFAEDYPESIDAFSQHLQSLDQL